MLAHAYLFSGEEGIGKKMTALALAAAVNCHRPASGDGCGECPSCRKVASLGHPDVHFIAAEGDEIKIDQVRQAQADLALKPFEGAKKVLIVDGAEGMNPASANAFLKTLEEPPGEALILLITALPHSLLPTIRSRCQEVAFHPLPRRTLADALMQRRGLSEGDAWFLAALSRGSIGRALGMDVEQEKLERDEFSDLWAQLGEMGADEVLGRADVLSKDRDQLERLIDIGAERLRDALVYSVTGDAKLLVYPRHVELHADERRHSLVRTLMDIELFFQGRGLLDRRVSGQLVAENLLLTMGKG